MFNHRISIFLLLLLLSFFPGCSSSDDEIDGDGAPDGDDENESVDGDHGGDPDGESPPDGDTDLDAGESDRETDEQSLPWPGCDAIQSTKTLEEKARYFDQVARDRHIADDGLFRNLELDENLENVERWYHTENTILWSGIYLASQALRYAVTRDPETVENAKRILLGLLDLTRVTGVSGLYGRCLAKPGVPYPPVAEDHPGWTDSPAEGYEGWRFRNDVSKDGYDGLMMGYALALEHFEDARLLSDIRARVAEIAKHIVDNGLRIVDVSGEVTEHGRLYQSAGDDFPGFNALLATSWLKIAALAGNDAELDDIYYRCLMRVRGDTAGCPEFDRVDLGPYIDSMETMLYLFQAGCQQNYDNFDMCYQAMYPLARLEDDPALKARLVNIARNEMFHTENEEYQSVAPIGNAFFTFAYAAIVDGKPGEDAVLDDAVEAAVCKLMEFPEEKFVRQIPEGEQEEVCKSRLANPVAAETIPLSEYPFDNYLWRLDFFEINTREVAENRRMIYSPEDYLLAYWMGRYHGLIPEGM